VNEGKGGKDMRLMDRSSQIGPKHFNQPLQHSFFHISRKQIGGSITNDKREKKLNISRGKVGDSMMSSFPMRFH
jgi:hypothetical protein